MREVEQRLGAVEVLVNCAGWDEFLPFLETEEQFWRKVISINFEGALRTTRALLGGMIERGLGRIVNVASDAARVGSSQEAVYAGAKAGVVGFTKTIAREAREQRGDRQRRLPRTRPTRGCSKRWPRPRPTPSGC